MKGVRMMYYTSLNEWSKQQAKSIASCVLGETYKTLNESKEDEATVVSSNLKNIMSNLILINTARIPDWNRHWRDDELVPSLRKFKSQIKITTKNPTGDKLIRSKVEAKWDQTYTKALKKVYKERNDKTKSYTKHGSMFYNAKLPAKAPWDYEDFVYNDVDTLLDLTNERLQKE